MKITAFVFPALSSMSQSYAWLGAMTAIGLGPRFPVPSALMA
jgi:hypothetical protein